MGDPLRHLLPGRDPLGAETLTFAVRERIEHPVEADGQAPRLVGVVDERDRERPGALTRDLLGALGEGADRARNALRENNADSQQ